MKKKLLFVDRDGCLVEETEDERVDRLDKVRLMPLVIPALRRILDAGYHLVMVTNQDGLGRPEFPRAGFQQAHDWILDLFATQGITFDEVLVDVSYPHEGLDTRKPGIGLVRHYAASDDWDRSASAMVGDRETDLQFAANLGVRGFRVGLGHLGWMEIADQLLAAPAPREEPARTC